MRVARQVIASIILLASTLYICNIAGFLPQWLNPKFLIDLQLIPAILSASVASLIILAALTFLLGRIYCSVLCPLGITQDLMIRLSNWIKKKWKIKRSRVYYKIPR
ncbi:MAG: 4Fe-4S binding protein, partial [Bacteroidales bacterium]|nr:4Fe-4S binding protein [Bacteroidales bacterium]